MNTMVGWVQVIPTQCRILGGPLRPLLFVFLLLSLTACRPMTNFADPVSPVFVGRYAMEGLQYPGTIKVVTWNIKFSQRIETAIEELKSTAELRDADLLLLQEMDEEGVDAIAQALSYNYAYFPASIHTRHDRNFGNAVLSKWPLRDASKLLLPHENPKNGQRRIAVKATATIGDHDVVAYSVHTETLWLDGRRREDQVDHLVSEQANQGDRVLVGGDFNTMTQAGVEVLVDAFDEAGFQHVSANTGPTFTAAGLHFTADHLFARGVLPIVSGVWPETEASDHYPLWAVLLPGNPTAATDAVDATPP